MKLAFPLCVKREQEGLQPAEVKSRKGTWRAGGDNAPSTEESEPEPEVGGKNRVRL